VELPVIWLWMAGGMPHTETLDPKAPPEGPSVTLAPGLAALERVLPLGVLIRSVVPFPTTDHATATQLWLGRAPAEAVRFGPVCALLDDAPSVVAEAWPSPREVIARLEAGARWMELRTDNTPGRGWDAHSGGLERFHTMRTQIDAPVGELITALAVSGWLGRARVVLASEFSRQARWVPGDGGGITLHQHSVAAQSVLVFGPGVPRGRIIGRTSPAWPYEVTYEAIDAAPLVAWLSGSGGMMPGWG
jgi:Protein of unknown function (DUF1501)